MTTSDPALAAVLAHVDAHREPFLARLVEYLRHPSISAQNKGIAEVAALLLDQLRAIGLATALVETPGHPMVLGRRENHPGKPTILLYGHYDVQPPEPLELWDSPPFTLTRVGGGGTMTVNNLALDPTPDLVPIGNGNQRRWEIQPNDGIFDFRVGGTLNVGANQAGGTYDGTFVVTVQYQ